MATCTWPIDVESCCKPIDLEVNDPRVLSIIEQVSEMMTRWSGFRVGGCKTVRPLDPCGECRSGCCASGDCIVLHDATSVTEVRVFGEVIPADQWHFDGARGVLCAVPPLEWPNRDARFEDVGALEVDTLVGEAPDAWALAVAQELACELITSCTGGKCRLPRNVTQVTGQGVTIQMSEDDLKYALPAVVSWARTINPLGAASPARMFSPEADRARVMGARTYRGVPSFRGTPWGR